MSIVASTKEYLMKAFRKLLQKDIESYISGVLLGLITFLIFFEVVSRSLFNWTISGTEEIIRLFFAWFVLLAAVTATKKYAHIKIEFFVAQFNPITQQIFLLVVDILVIIFLIFFIISGISYLRFEMYSSSTILEIPDSFFIISIPVAGLLMLLYRFFSFKKNVSRRLFREEGKK